MWPSTIPTERPMTQPLEEVPGDVRNVCDALEMVGADDVLLYASGYALWDFDNPRIALRAFPPDWQRRILHENPGEFFNLPKS